MNRYFVCLVAIPFLAACGDDDASVSSDANTTMDTSEDVALETGDDVGTDVVPDAVPDAEPDTEPDAEPDTEPDTEPDADGGDADSGDAVDPCVPESERSWAECSDGVDNDCDGLIDSDPACNLCPPSALDIAGEENTLEFCSDGLDNDCNGYVDCSDFACRGVAECPVTEDTPEICSDGIDNDGDGRIDCLQRSCAPHCEPPTLLDTESTVEACGNLLDDDGNGRVDCDDDGCTDLGYCMDRELDEEGACADGLDNDGDGYVDCRDSGCRASDACGTENDPTACSNDLDDDGDGRVDCADLGCTRFDVCGENEDSCSDGVDNDLDGFVDCRDFDCVEAPECLAAACDDDNHFGTCDDVRATCALGECAVELSEFDLGAFDPILITELMPNPDVFDDRDAEYIEITNMTDDTLNLSGMTLSVDDGRDLTIGTRFLLNPRQILLFVVSNIEEDNGGISGFEDTFNLSNEGDTATISYRGTTIHSVEYESSTPHGLGSIPLAAEAGRSFSLDQAYLDDREGVAPRWCFTRSSRENEYAPNNYGTPAAPNPVCAD